MDKKDLNLEEDDISYNVARTNTRRLRQIRRFSVFSKSFDPEYGELRSHSETDFESMANRPFESSKSSVLDYAENLKKIMSNIILFKHLSDDDLDRIVECMFQRPCSRNEVIIRQGDPGNYFYIIAKGVFDVYLKRAGDELKMAELGEHGFFGDLALLHNQARCASVVCQSDGVLLCMNRDTFQRKVISISFDRRRKYANLLGSISFLRDSLSDTERSKVVDALESRLVEANETLFSQNEMANGMYFVESGKVKISQMDENGNKEIIKVVEKGDYFGEFALLRKTNRTATACTLTKCQLAFLDVDAFERLMGPCFNLLEKHQIDYYKEFK